VQIVLTLEQLVYYELNFPDRILKYSWTVCQDIMQCVLGMTQQSYTMYFFNATVIQCTLSILQLYSVLSQYYSYTVYSLNTTLILCTLSILQSYTV